MSFHIYARSSQPNLVDIGGNYFEISYIQNGNKIALSSEGWDRIQKTFQESVFPELTGDLSSLERIVLSLDTKTLQTWDQSTGLHQTASTSTRVADSVIYPFTDVLQKHKTGIEKEKEEQRLFSIDPSQPYQSSSRPAPLRPLTEDDRFRILEKKGHKEVIALDFEERFGLLYNESLAYYLSLFRFREDDSQILLRGENSKSLFPQNDLIEWAKGTDGVFGKALSNLIDSSIQKIYIPFNSNNHFQMLVIDRTNRQIIGYNPTGNFATDDQRKIFECLLRIFKNYTTISDEAFPIDHYEEIIEGRFEEVRKTHQPRTEDGHCGIYVIHFIHQMDAGEDPDDIFKSPVSDKEIQRIRRFCATEVRNS